MSTPVPIDERSMAVLLRHAGNAYSGAMETALHDAGYDDIPKYGLYVLGGLARKGGRPLGQLIEELRMSKQAAGQLVDALVARGYLTREIDPDDRRRLVVALTDRGRAAARKLGAALAAVDADLVARVGAKEVDRARRVLIALASIGSDPTVSSYVTQRPSSHNRAISR